MRLIIKNYLSHAVKIHHKFSEVIYAPNFQSSVQEEFYQKRYKELLDIIPHAVWGQNVIIEKLDKVLCSKTFYEVKKYSGKILDQHNYLFDDYSYDVADNFTKFRKQAETLLPDSFSDFVRPYDSDVNLHLQKYFSSNAPSTYFETRNALLGDSYSTKFSRYLSCGSVDVRYIYNLVKDYEAKNGANKSTYWIIFELLWREFFYWHYQKVAGKKYFSSNGLKGEYDFSIVKSFSIDELYKLHAHPFFYASLNELKITGFLSNRARQMFASIWINDLNLPWRSGAHLFEKYLIDYDVFSNYGNWMYLAGVGVDPRGKRYFSIDKQLDQYDPDRDYLKAWLN